MFKKEPESKRDAMKRVRAFVKGFLHGKNPDNLSNLSEYPTNMADARRTIIALQDRLERSVCRHKAASDLIEKTARQTREIIGGYVSNEISLLTKIAHQDTELNFAEESKAEIIEQLEMMRTELNTERDISAEMGQALDANQLKLDSALMTIKTLMEV